MRLGHGHRGARRAGRQAPFGDGLLGQHTLVVEPDHARGGRLYDSWRTERKLSSIYTYDQALTPELDGKGGPDAATRLFFAQKAFRHSARYEAAIAAYFAQVEAKEGAFAAGAAEDSSRELPEETPIALVHDATTTAVMMATPADLEDLGLGFSLSERIVARPEEITGLITGAIHAA